MPPQKLICVSDSNKLELVRTIKTKTETSFEYQFTKSETKEGMLMTISEKALEKCLKNEILKDANK